MQRGALADNFWSEEGTLLLGAVLGIALVGATTRGIWRLVRSTRRLRTGLLRRRSTSA